MLTEIAWMRSDVWIGKGTALRHARLTQIYMPQGRIAWDIGLVLEVRMIANVMNTCDPRRVHVGHFSALGDSNRSCSLGSVD